MYRQLIPTFGPRIGLPQRNRPPAGPIPILSDNFYLSIGLNPASCRYYWSILVSRPIGCKVSAAPLTDNDQLIFLNEGCKKLSPPPSWTTRRLYTIKGHEAGQAGVGGRIAKHRRFITGATRGFRGEPPGDWDRRSCTLFYVYKLVIYCYCKLQ